MKAAKSKEVWKSPGYAHLVGLYEVSNFGRIRSKRAKKIMAGGLNSKGYRTFVLPGPDGRRKTYYAHTLVLTAFVGFPQGDANQCRHLNGDSTDNRLVNLTWGTAKENAADRKVHGTVARGEMIHTCQLTEAQVINIIELLQQGIRAAELAAQYGVSRRIIWRIASGDTWNHIPRPTRLLAVA